MLRRAGLFTRLVNLSKLLCLIPFSLCHYYEASEAKNTKKDLSQNTFLPQQNVTEPLITLLSQRTKTETLYTSLSQQTRTEPLYASLSLLAKMELHQREGLHNNAGPDLETCDRIPCYRNGCPHYTKLVSFLQEQEWNPLIQECVPTLQEQVKDEAGPVRADVCDEGYDEVSQICASKGHTL